MQIDVMPLGICRQTLAFVEVRSAALLPARIEYLHRGSLEYEFGSELLQTPIQLLKISDAEAQVPLQMFPLIPSFVKTYILKKHPQTIFFFSQKIVETLNHLVTNNQYKVHEDAPLKFVELLQLLRVVAPSVLESLWSKFESKPQYR